MDEILKQILNELKELKAGQQETNTRLDNLETGQKEIITDMKQVKLAVLETNRTVKHIESDMDLLFEKTNNTERELNRLKNLQ